jgi:cobyrinic acid a,c-diamide synthase
MTDVANVPRLVVAGTASGVGKTTMVVGLTRALRARGLRVAVFKCGPDYLDPTYHARAAGTPSHNLDGWMMGRDAVVSTFTRVCADAAADVALIEGVMGLFDGVGPTSNEGSTAEIAGWLDAPVLLCVDASGMARSIAAIAHGFATYDPGVRLAGVLCNRVGSKSHLEILAKASSAPPVLGGLLENAELTFPERHLGLRTAAEDAVPEARFDACGARASETIGLDAVLRIARFAPPLPLPEANAAPAATSATSARVRLALAHDAAFHFYYDDNLRRLEALGAELVRFSPIADAALPSGTDGVLLGGGYPEAHAAALAANVAMRGALTRFAAAGGPIYAECGGLMYLTRGLRTLDGTTHEMVGLLPGVAVMHPRLRALGYVEVETQAPTLLGAAGLRFRGHQFRYSELAYEDADAATPVASVYSVRRRRSGEVVPEGYLAGSVLGSYVHAHWASNPQIPANLVAACEARRHSR